MHDSGTYALHRLLSTARSKADSGIAYAWTETLGASAGSEDFARKMSEVGALLDETVRAVDSIDSPRSREKYHRYTYGWWTAVYQPDSQWNGPVSAAGFIAQVHLDQLDSLAEYLDERGERPADAPTPSDDQMQQMKEHCVDWLEWLESLDETQLPRALRHQLAEHFRQAIWLIDNSHLFGPIHAAEAVRAATDAVFVQAPRRMSKENVGKMLKRWAATSGLVGLILVGPTAGVELGTQVLEGIKTGIEVIEQARDAGLLEPRAITAAPAEDDPLQIEAVPTDRPATSESPDGAP